MNNTTLSLQYPKLLGVVVPPPTDTSVTNQVITAVSATLIPLIIIINLVSINGIIKTKRKKLNSFQILFLILFVSDIPAGNYLFKVNHRNTRTRCEICSKLKVKTPERRQASFWCLYF